MKPIFQNIVDGFREDFGHPASLERFLAEHPEIRITLDDPARCISAESIVQWHELGMRFPLARWPRREPGTITGWSLQGREYALFETKIQALNDIGRGEVAEGFMCDITEVEGFSASKSDLRAFAHTDEMVEANSKDMIDEITPEKLEKHLAHREIRIIHAPGADYFGRYLWDGRLFLMNDGGSHHLAAAKYIAARLGMPVKLYGSLRTYSLNECAVAALCRDFAMFAVPDEVAITQGIHDTMSAFRATWLHFNLPRPLDNIRVVMLPKNEKRSMQVAGVLAEFGVADFGAHLTSIARRQTQR